MFFPHTLPGFYLKMEENFLKFLIVRSAQNYQMFSTTHTRHQKTVDIIWRCYFTATTIVFLTTTTIILWTDSPMVVTRQSIHTLHKLLDSLCLTVWAWPCSAAPYLWFYTLWARLDIRWVSQWNWDGNIIGLVSVDYCSFNKPNSKLLLN